MSSTFDLNLKVILFVGRPADSKKGLTVLFEAAEVMERLTDVPKFSIWVVGGSPREILIISRYINSVPLLKTLSESGRISLWGRIENEALSEFYSRATVTVVPSFQEEFGIVAVEAMMSGCPVVASRVGGLADIVETGATGTLFEQGDAVVLAGVIVGYLRDPLAREVYGAEARESAVAHFSIERTYATIQRMYQDGPDPPEMDEGSLPSHSLRASSLAQRLGEILGDSDISIEEIDTNRHSVFRVRTSEGIFAAKYFKKKPSPHTALSGLFTALPSVTGGNVSYNRENYNRDNPAARPIVYSELEPEPMVVTSWCDEVETTAAHSLDELVLGVIETCQGYRPLPDDDEDLMSYIDALQDYSSNKDPFSMASYDLASSKLNARVLGETAIYCRSHPQVELQRYRQVLNSRVLPLPESFVIRSMHLTDFLLNAMPVIIDRPLLAHTDLKPEHLRRFNGKVCAIDFECTRYAVGPLDLAVWLIATRIRGRFNADPDEVVELIKRVVETETQRYLCVCWVAVEVFFYSIMCFSMGNSKELQVAHNFMKNFAFVLCNKSIIR